MPEAHLVPRTWRSEAWLQLPNRAGALLRLCQNSKQGHLQRATTAFTQGAHTSSQHIGDAPSEREFGISAL